MRNLEQKHNAVVTRYAKDIARLESRYSSLWEKVNQQAWQISELINRPAPRPAPSPSPERPSLLDRVDKRLNLGKYKKSKKLMWDRVDTDLMPFPFSGERIDYTWMHRALTKQKHDAWKLMVE